MRLPCSEPRIVPGPRAVDARQIAPHSVTDVSPVRPAPAASAFPPRRERRSRDDQYPARGPRPRRELTSSPTRSTVDTGPQTGAARSSTPSPATASRRLAEATSRLDGYARPELGELSRQMVLRGHDVDILIGMSECHVARHGHSQPRITGDRHNACSRPRFRRAVRESTSISPACFAVARFDGSFTGSCLRRCYRVLFPSGRGSAFRGTGALRPRSHPRLRAGDREPSELYADLRKYNLLHRLSAASHYSRRRSALRVFPRRCEYLGVFGVGLRCRGCP